MAQLTTRLDNDLHDRLKLAAFERRWSVNRAINIAVFQLLERLKEEDEAK